MAHGVIVLRWDLCQVVARFLTHHQRLCTFKGLRDAVGVMLGLHGSSLPLTGKKDDYGALDGFLHRLSQPQQLPV